MSQVKGTISVDVAFTDSTTVGGAQSLKTITLREATEYTTGKVAIVTGTVGTAAVSLWTFDGQGLANQYRNAGGQLVGEFVPARIALRASGGGAVVTDDDLNALRLVSLNNEAAVGSNQGTSGSIASLTGTCSYTVVLYGT